jgi:hypothetical protein
MTTACPSLYQVNTRLLIAERGRALGRPATLDDWPDEEVDRLAALGFDWVWLLGVWRLGAAARACALTELDWRPYREALPDLSDADIVSSPFAVTGYEANPEYGGEAALARTRGRLRRRGLRLLLDFVPNHTARDHPWARQHPEYYVAGTDDDLRRAPRNYARVDTAAGPRVLAHGRDPYFPGWTDTLQLNYRHAGLREAMARELERVAGRCDGVRCDMAMLVLPDVIRRTWGEASRPADGSGPVEDSFWPGAITRVRARQPDFLFMAEVYWGLDEEMLRQGFDYVYDKVLYDRLVEGSAEGVRRHLEADPELQRHCVRFLENHDEPRAAKAFAPETHRAAAVATYFTPGLRFFHDGQLEGRRFRVPMQLARLPDEPADQRLAAFYRRLLAGLRRPEAREGRWHLLGCRPAWDGNPTWQRFLAYLLEGADGRRLLVCINYGPTQGQCYVGLPVAGLGGRAVLLQDLMGDACYERDGNDLAARGLYLDMPAWGYHVFALHLH